MRKITAALAATLCLGFGAATAVPAQAHLGDWARQRSVTYNDMLRLCRANWGGFCPDWRYDGSGQYGDHSRYFVWQRTTSGGRYCTDTYYIGHSYTIFTEYHDCR